LAYLFALFLELEITTSKLLIAAYMVFSISCYGQVTGRLPFIQGTLTIPGGKEQADYNAVCQRTTHY
jgi:hypothetical protein